MEQVFKYPAIPDIKIANFTCDGDSRAFQGVSRSQSHRVGHLKDLRHLGTSLKRE
ncbi:hypothetical protein DPMN_154949 [Dreissena polymorpha]|uniref:Uncharacterized protein n=1 Tax=Dreissena polymorpha TaxID=45954 RepID=A0A9D4FNL9_DREPO|nr:hypothetical protein DPMN_154949 [Dreissena polymorpha]